MHLLSLPEKNIRSPLESRGPVDIIDKEQIGKLGGVESLKVHHRKIYECNMHLIFSFNEEVLSRHNCVGKHDDEKNLHITDPDLH